MYPTQVQVVLGFGWPLPSSHSQAFDEMICFWPLNADLERMVRSPQAVWVAEGELEPGPPYSYFFFYATVPQSFWLCGQVGRGEGMVLRVWAASTHTCTALFA